MKIFVNDVSRMLRESLQGFELAHSNLVRVEFEPTFVARRTPSKNKVALVSGGGSGHEPLHVGYVGRGALDAACPGQVFTSPTPDQMVAAAQAVDTGRGLLFIVKNYAGDAMNFEMAAEMLTSEVATVLVNDDVAVETSTHSAGRRGVAGTLMVEKMVGALAEQGAPLPACKALGERVNARTGSMGVAFTSCTVPAAGRPTFDIGPNEMEVGVGIHGEPGRKRIPHAAADDIVRLLLDAILTALKPARGGRVLLHVNGFGGTTLLELYLLHGAAHAQLVAAGLTPVRSLVGNYTTSLEMAGASLTVTVLDDELLALWDAPVETAVLHW